MRRTISGAAGLEKISLTKRERLGAPGAQQLLDPVEELVAASLVDVEQGDPRAFQAGRTRGERLGRAPALVERAHVIHGTSVMT